MAGYISKGKLNLKTDEVTWIIPPPEIDIFKLPEGLRESAIKMFLKMHGIFEPILIKKQTEVLNEKAE